MKFVIEGLETALAVIEASDQKQAEKLFRAKYPAVKIIKTQTLKSYHKNQFDKTYSDPKNQLSKSYMAALKRKQAQAICSHNHQSMLSAGITCDDCRKVLHRT